MHSVFQQTVHIFKQQLNQLILQESSVTYLNSRNITSTDFILLQTESFIHYLNIYYVIAIVLTPRQVPQLTIVSKTGDEVTKQKEEWRKQQHSVMYAITTRRVRTLFEQQTQWETRKHKSSGQDGTKKSQTVGGILIRRY